MVTPIQKHWKNYDIYLNNLMFEISNKNCTNIKKYACGLKFVKVQLFFFFLKIIKKNLESFSKEYTSTPFIIKCMWSINYSLYCRRQTRKQISIMRNLCNLQPHNTLAFFRVLDPSDASSWVTYSAKALSHKDSPSHPPP